MTGDGDRLLTLFGIGLVAFIVIGLGVGILAAMNASSTGGEEATAPEANWTVERANGSYVRIVHTEGEPVDTSEVFVTVDGIERTVAWSGEVGPGDGGLVRARPEQIVRLYWHGGRGSDVVLESWTV